ncbi:MAG TPA: AAA family ATPase [Candidatus Onthomonas avicola]|nr:AAA family ATPase [Candidatus Onthomonas avicola]
MAKHLYLIGGPMGVGKTAVGQALKRLLPRCAFLDGDWCWDADPFRVTGETKAMVLDNIRHLLGNFLRCGAYDNVVFCWVMDRTEIWDAVTEGLPLEGCVVHRVVLLCTPETLRSRLEGDIAAGRRTEDVLARGLDYLPRCARLPFRQIDTTGRSPEEAAQLV